MLCRGETTTGCTTRKPKVVLFQKIWLQNASSQVTRCLRREFSLKIHISPMMYTQNSTHPLLQQLTHPELMPWIEVTTFFFSQKQIAAGQTKEKLYFLLAFSLKREHKVSPGSSVLWSGKCHGLPTTEGRREVQKRARLSTTNVVQPQQLQSQGLLK